jgi:hypothetical protein
MTGPGRNDPCPCGSGKKYKKCCLAGEREARREAARPAPSELPIRTTLRWLDRHHEERVREAVQEFLELAGEDGPDVLPALSDELIRMLEINALEWMMADGVFLGEDELGEDDVAVPDLLLGDGGPRYTDDERSWMEAFTSRPLGLYEVQETIPGERLRMKDLLHPEDPEVWVADRAASGSLVRWDVLGARLVPWRDTWTMSGGLYPLTPGGDLPTFVRTVREELDHETADDPEMEREVLASLIPELWFDEILEPAAEMPELVDASTGDPILLVTDYYRVRSWERLEAALAAREDVEGDRDEGWTRFEEIDEDARRSLLAINPERGDRLTAFARTRRRADEGREWLEAVAGDAVVHRTREISDPRSPALSGGKGGRSRPPGGPGPEIPMTSEIMEQIFRTQYRNWADDEIPALGGKTPREAVGTAKGREEVIGLLKMYEQGEERAARKDRREPVSFQFLWEAVGLDRETEAGES